MENVLVELSPGQESIFCSICELVNRVGKNLDSTVYGTFADLLAPEEKNTCNKLTFFRLQNLSS